MNKYYIEIRPIFNYKNLDEKEMEATGPVIESYPLSEFEWENDILPPEVYSIDRKKYAIYKSERI